MLSTKRKNDATEGNISGGYCFAVLVSDGEPYKANNEESFCRREAWSSAAPRLRDLCHPETLSKTDERLPSSRKSSARDGFAVVCPAFISMLWIGCVARPVIRSLPGWPAPIPVPQPCVGASQPQHPAQVDSHSSSKLRQRRSTFQRPRRSCPPRQRCSELPLAQKELPHTNHVRRRAGRIRRAAAAAAPAPATCRRCRQCRA